MLKIDSFKLQKKLDALILQRKQLIMRRKAYMDFRDLAFKRHTQFTYAHRLMVRTNLGLEWGLRFLSQHQNELLDTRFNIQKDWTNWGNNPNYTFLNKKALLKNWDAWVAVQSKLQKLQWWVHTHERILLNCRLKLMKNQEVLEKILRDIMSIEIQARKLIVNTIEMVDYNEFYWKMYDLSKNPETISDLISLYWHHPSKFLTTKEWEYNRLLRERTLLLKEQKILLEKLNKITKKEYYLAVRQEETANTWDNLSWWHGRTLNKQFWYLKRERWHMSDLKKIVFNPKYYWEDYNELNMIEWDLNQYTDYFWENREELQFYQPYLTRARLSGQYYLQLLKETQIDIMKNQADLINLQEFFFKKFQPHAEKYHKSNKRINRIANKKTDTKFMYKKFIKNLLKNLPDVNYLRLEIFPYLIKILFLRRIELPFETISPHSIHYYNSITDSSGEEQYFFLSIKLPFPLVSHWGILIYLRNEDNEYRRGPWWKWRSMSEIYYDWSLQKPINICKELLFGSEHIDSYYRWGNHYTVDKHFAEDLYKYKTFKFDKKFYSELNKYKNNYYTDWVGDELGYPGECTFSKDFGTYYYHSGGGIINSNISEILNLTTTRLEVLNLDERFERLFNKKFEKKLDNFLSSFQQSAMNSSSSLNDFIDETNCADFDILVDLAKDLDKAFNKTYNSLNFYSRGGIGSREDLTFLTRKVCREHYYTIKKKNGKNKMGNSLVVKPQSSKLISWVRFLFS